MGNWEWVPLTEKWRGKCVEADLSASKMELNIFSKLVSLEGPEGRFFVLLEEPGSIVWCLEACLAAKTPNHNHLIRFSVSICAGTISIHEGFLRNTMSRCTKQDLSELFFSSGKGEMLVFLFPTQNRSGRRMQSYVIEVGLLNSS